MDSNDNFQNPEPKSKITLKGFLTDLFVVGIMVVIILIGIKLHQNKKEKDSQKDDVIEITNRDLYNALNKLNNTIERQYLMIDSLKKVNERLLVSLDSNKDLEQKTKIEYVKNYNIIRNSDANGIYEFWAKYRFGNNNSTDN